MNSERGQTYRKTVSMPGTRRISSGAYNGIFFSDIEKLVVGPVTKELIEEEEGAGFGGSENSEHGKRMTVALQAAREDTSKFEHAQYPGFVRSFFQTTLIGSRRSNAPRLTSEALWRIVTGLEDDFVTLLWASSFRNHVHFQTTVDRYPLVAALLKEDYSVDIASVTPDVFGGPLHARKLNLQKRSREILRQTPVAIDVDSDEGSEPREKPGSPSHHESVMYGSRSASEQHHQVRENESIYSPEGCRINRKKGKATHPNRNPKKPCFGGKDDGASLGIESNRRHAKDGDRNTSELYFEIEDDDEAVEIKLNRQVAHTTVQQQIYNKKMFLKDDDEIWWNTSKAHAKAMVEDDEVRWIRSEDYAKDQQRRQIDTSTWSVAGKDDDDSVENDFTYPLTDSISQETAALAASMGIGVRQLQEQQKAMDAFCTKGSNTQTPKNRAGSWYAPLLGNGQVLSSQKEKETQPKGQSRGRENLLLDVPTDVGGLAHGASLQNVKMFVLAECRKHGMGGVTNTAKIAIEAYTCKEQQLSDYLSRLATDYEHADRTLYGPVADFAMALSVVVSDEVYSSTPPMSFFLFVTPTSRGSLVL